MSELENEKVKLAGQEFTVKEICSCLRVLIALEADLSNEAFVANRFEQFDSSFSRAGRITESGAVRSVRDILFADALIMNGYSVLRGDILNPEPQRIDRNTERLKAIRLLGNYPKCEEHNQTEDNHGGEENSEKE